MIPLLLALLQSYGDVDAVFRKHCVSCHNPKELKGELNLESHAGLLKGGENGPVVESLVALLEHAKKPFMPPPKKAPKLSPAEIDVVRKWVAAGAPAPGLVGDSRPGGGDGSPAGVRGEVAGGGPPRGPGELVERVFADGVHGGAVPQLGGSDPQRRQPGGD